MCHQVVCKVKVAKARRNERLAPAGRVRVVDPVTSLWA